MGRMNQSGVGVRTMSHNHEKSGVGVRTMSHTCEKNESEWSRHGRKK